MWGWFALLEWLNGGEAVYPTGVGMVLREFDGAGLCRRLPHGCGDGSPYRFFTLASFQFTPRVWGWFGLRTQTQRIRRVYPTGVGMVRIPQDQAPLDTRLPHGCGDGSFRVWPVPLSLRFTPRVWGWFSVVWRSVMFAPVYPTGVGMVRSVSTTSL